MIDPTVAMAHQHVNEFLPSSGPASGHRNAIPDPDVDDLDVSRFNALRKEKNEQLRELEKYYHDKRDAINKQVQAEQESLFSAFQQGMQNFYASLVQHITGTIEDQVKLRLEKEKLDQEYAAQQREIDRRYHHEASRLVTSTSHATRPSKPLPRTASNGSHTNSFSGSNGEHYLSTPTAAVMQTPPVQHQTVTRPVSTEHLPRDFVLQEPPRREYLAPYPTPQECVPSQRIPAPSEPRPIQPQPVRSQPLPVRQTYEEAIQGQPQKLSHQTSPYHEHSALTPSRSEFKRKAHDLPVHDATLNGLNSKRPRTSEKTVDGVFQDPHQHQIKPSPRTPRSLQPTRETYIDRTIPFEEIYQDGKAQYKHKIFEHKAGSGNWYIVRCDEHQVHFGHGNPLHGAAKHVHSPQHGNLEKKHDLALQICGHRITGCNAELAALNNSVFEHAVKEENYTVFNLNLLTKDKRRLHDAVDVVSAAKGSGSAKKKPPRLNINSDDANGVRDCEFYQGWWSPHQRYYPLVVLPILPGGSLKDAGLPEITLQETELMTTVPKCYRVDRNSLQIKEWQLAYKMGGTKVERREYPVMFFDGMQKNSLGWLRADKLRPLNLDNPPEDIDKRGLSVARTWFAQKMMHRNDWEDYKKLGPGKPSNVDGELNKDVQVPSLRSARADVQSPIRDKSSKPVGFSVSSSEEDSDEEGRTKPNIRPNPEPVNSQYADDSSELSDVDMEDIQPSEKSDHSVGKVVHESNAEPRPPTLETAIQAPTPGKEATPEIEVRRPPTSSAISDHEQLRKDAQARAAAAVMEAASRSRASSEVPAGVSPDGAPLPTPNSLREPDSGQPSRPSGPEHHRSRSDNNFSINGGNGTTFGGHEPRELQKRASDLHNILNQDQVSKPVGSNETSEDPYKRAMAIAAQMEGLKSRSASAPIHEGKGTPSPFPPPPLPPVQVRQQQSPSLSHILSPPVQSPLMMPPRSSSSTPVQAGRESPKMSALGQHDKWQAMRSTANKASFVNTPSQIAMPQPQAMNSTQLGTPISDKQENFDVSQFRDSTRGVRWSRDGPGTGFLRLTTDSMRGWAETAKGSPLTATIEPLKIARIEVDPVEGEAEKERVSLIHKDGNQQMLVFEMNSENQRLVKAAVQRRRFVTWMRKINSSVEYRISSENRRGSTVMDDRWSVATG